MAEPLATAERLAVHLQRRDLLEDFDATEALAQAVELASGVVRSFCGWGLTTTTQTDLFRGDGQRTQLLATMRLITVEVTEAESGALVNDFDFYPSGILFRAGRWTGALSVTFTHGYSLEELPAALVAVVLAVAARAYTNPEALVREQVGPAAPSFTQVGPNQAGGFALLGVEQAILNRFRLP